MKKDKRPCNHQTEDSSVVHLSENGKMLFNYCPWCGSRLLPELDKPEEDENG